MNIILECKVCTERLLHLEVLALLPTEELVDLLHDHRVHLLPPVDLLVGLAYQQIQVSQLCPGEDEKIFHFQGFRSSESL